MAEITTELIQQLREKTGVGMMDCKKALIESKGDIEKAIEFLRKKGAAVAAKRSGNEAKNGLIHAYIHPGAKVGVLLEISCETDFAANTESMHAFAKDVCMQIAAANPISISPEEVDNSLIEKELEIIREQLKQAGKPENLINKIAESKLEKFYETSCLLKQKFIKNDKISIQDLLNDLIAKIGESIKIKKFARYQIG
ncbi:TPA: translation elongation factor Ts [Candidatus Dependentiae bacterium]|nr:MAG: Elongation factor Ts [candidate division TM6 bacterium GW2011_GWF2_33_332]HBS48112.1 translation elongation factor Ts [Candidatus Dependentiae bacterium]HBZ73536.1 translation elongation factor Ts [Candidatus Dependentiae bacterium]